MRKTIIWLGSGNFLCFADCSINGMNRKGLYGGKIAIHKDGVSI